MAAAVEEKKVALRQSEKRKDLFDKSELNYCAGCSEQLKENLYTVTCVVICWHMFCLERTSMIRKPEFNRKL